jgi:hypothetical protein
MDAVVPSSINAPVPASLHPCSLLLDTEIRPPDFVIAPFFPRGELTVIAGAHGNFKSTIALDACLAVASGRPWGGVPSVQGRSVFITLEDSDETLARRVKAWLEGVYQTSDLFAAEQKTAAVERDLRANFSFLGREDAQGLVLTATHDGTTSPRLEVAERLAQLTAGASLVVIETVARLHDGPETNDAFAALVRSLERITANGAALVVVHHMSKNDARNMTDPESVDSYAGRGGGALADAARSCLVVTRSRGNPLGPVALTAAKTTHAQSGDTISWDPIVVPTLGCVRLAHRTPESLAVNDAELLFAHIASIEGGITRRQLHNHQPHGLTRNRALAALDYLNVHGRLVPCDEVRGRNKQVVTVYNSPRPGLEAA